MHIKIKGVDGSLWDLDQDIVYNKRTGVMRRNKNTFTRSGVEHYANDGVMSGSHIVLVILFCVLIAVCLLPFVLGYRLPYSLNATTGLLTQRH